MGEVSDGIVYDVLEIEHRRLCEAHDRVLAEHAASETCADCGMGLFDALELCVGALLVGGALLWGLFDFCRCLFGSGFF